jgi:hypothetical protein
MNPPTPSRPDEPPAQTGEPTPTPSAGPAVPDFEPVRIPAAILEAQAAFERDLPRLLKERPGQWVAYRPEGPVVFAATDLALYRECERLGLREFITRCIEPWPEMDFISGFEVGPWDYLPP